MGSIQNKDLETSSQRLRTACIMKTTVPQSALHGLPCEETKKTNTTKTRRNIELGGFGFTDYRNEMAICTKIWNTTYDGTPGVRQHGFGFKSYKEKKLEIVPIC